MRGLVNQAGGIQNFFGDGSDGTIPVLSAITTAPNGGTVANLWDMNAGTVFTTNALTTADQVLFSIDCGTPIIIPSTSYQFWLQQAAISAGANRTVQVQYSDDNTVWTSSGASGLMLATTPASGATSSTTSGPHRHWRLVLLAGGSACTFTCQGVIFSAISTDTQTTKAWNIVFPSALNGPAVVKQFSSLTLPVGYSMTVENPCQGLIIYCQGEAVINGTVDMSQKAGLAPNGNIIPMPITKKATITSKTSSLLHFDNNITDANGRTWTNNGTATFDATNKKFGSHAISLNGTNQWIDTPVSDDFSFGQDDFTIDFWMRPTTVGTGVYVMSDADNTSGNASFTILRRSSNKIALSVSGYPEILSTTLLSINTWYHVAAVRNKGIGYLYINGMMEGYASSPNSKRNLAKFTIGRVGEYSANYFAGQIDEFRVVKGKAMYTANFSVPVAEYTYTATYTDTPKTLEKYLQLTTVLQPLRGGYGGNGGYGGGYSGSTGRQTGVGVGGGGRINAGGFGGGGSSGALGYLSKTGAIGGSILFSEIGGGKLTVGIHSGSTYGMPIDGINGSGAIAPYQTGGNSNSGNVGKANGGGTGGTGGAYGVNSSASTDSQYAGGFICLISGGNISGSGTLKADGGAGSAGTNGAGANTGGGGSGAGSGGGVIAEYYKGTNTFAGTRSVAGGTAGTAGTGTSTGEAGGAGTSGSLGTIHIQQVA